MAQISENTDGRRREIFIRKAGKQEKNFDHEINERHEKGRENWPQRTQRSQKKERMFGHRWHRFHRY
jgi:hypothetical protein